MRLCAFGEDLAWARASIVPDLLTAVVITVAEWFGQTEDPRYIRGWRDAIAVDTAIRIMWLGCGSTKSMAANRMGYTAPRASYVASYELNADEVGMWERAQRMVGHPYESSLLVPA